MWRFSKNPSSKLKIGVLCTISDLRYVYIRSAMLQGQPQHSNTSLEIFSSEFKFISSDPNNFKPLNKPITSAPWTAQPQKLHRKKS